MTNKADLSHWNRVHAQARPSIASKSDIIRAWIERHIPPAAGIGRTCIEIGCCPGRYLSVLGELGYELYGIDMAENIRTMPQWLKDRNYRVGCFWQEDFLAFDSARKFDVVMSLGFIEHFTNWEEVLKKHCDLVAANGYLVIEAPNFIGSFQHWFHAYLDRESFERHHVPAMDIDAWTSVLEAKGFEIAYRGYFGTFDFWVEPQQRNIVQHSVLKSLSALKRILKLALPRDRKTYSPVGGVIARRRS